MWWWLLDDGVVPEVNEKAGRVIWLRVLLGLAGDGSVVAWVFVRRKNGGKGLFGAAAVVLSSNSGRSLCHGGTETRKQW